MKRLIDLKIALAGVLLASSITVSAQDISEKRVQAGLTTNLGMNLITMGTTRMDASGIGGNFSIGIVMHSAFKSSKNLGIATGLDFDFATQKYSTKVPTFYRYSDTDILKKEDSGGDVFSLTDRAQKSTYITVPLMLLFRTDFIGDFRYFGKFGLRNSFLVASKFNDYGQIFGNTGMTENTGMKSPGEAFLYQGSVGLSAGAEWNFSGSTALVVEGGYYYGVTPQYLDRKENKRTLYTVDSAFQPVYYSNKSTMSQILFRISLLF
ncbi:MAG: hypothetical protein RL264_1081 [Bacteroidota bacterium]|jgi:hypothetical protein